jgi:hypothetical protein
MPGKLSVRALPSPTIVSTGGNGLPRKGSVSASSLNGPSIRESLEVESPEACTLDPAAKGEELDGGLEGGGVLGAGAGPVVLTAG